MNSANTYWLFSCVLLLARIPGVPLLYPSLTSDQFLFLPEKLLCYYSDMSTRNLEAGGRINSSSVLLVCSHCKDHLFPRGKMAHSLFFAISVSLNSCFLQRHLEPAKAAAERLSSPSINPLHCLSSIWHFRDAGLSSYVNCKYENGGTQQSECHSCEMHSLKAFLQCSKASTLTESLSYCFLTI